MQLWIQHQSVSWSHWQYVTRDSSSWKRHAHLWTLHNRRGPPRRFTWNSSLCHYIQPFTNTARWRHMMQCPLVFTVVDKLKLYGTDIQRLFSKRNILYIRNSSNLTRTCELVRGVFLPGGISAALWTGGPIMSSSAARHGCTTGSVRRISCLQLQVWKLIWWREKNEDQQISLYQTEKPLQMWTCYRDVIIAYSHSCNIFNRQKYVIRLETLCFYSKNDKTCLPSCKGQRNNK